MACHEQAESASNGDWWGQAPEEPIVIAKLVSFTRRTTFLCRKRAEPWSIVGHGSARSWNWHI
jgi:hypothetical protein